MRPNDTLLDLLLELQILDRVPRSGYFLRGVPEAESVSEHSFHVLFLVWALAREIPEIDATRAIELALVHDLAELRIGDLPRTSGRYFAEGAKHAAESAAAAEILAPLGERGAALFEEYQEARTPAARLVRACDKLQLMLKVTVYENWGANGLREFWNNPENFPEPEFAPVAELFEQLRQRHGESTR